MKNYRVVSNSDLAIIYAEFDTRDDAETAIIRNNWNGHIQFKSDREIQAESYKEIQESRKDALLFGIEIDDN